MIVENSKTFPHIKFFYNHIIYLKITSLTFKKLFFFINTVKNIY